MIAPQESQAGASDWNEAYWSPSIVPPSAGFGGSAARWSALTMTLDVTAGATVGVVAVFGDAVGWTFAGVAAFGSGVTVCAGTAKVKPGAGRKIALPFSSKKVMPSHRKM